MDLETRMPDRYRFVHGNICDGQFLDGLFAEAPIDGAIHFAAESHVDRSILGPMAFVETNVLGTCRLLEACTRHWEQKDKPDHFRFLHVSTDEVYGSLGEDGNFR